jgi:hypothetical protein
LICIAKGSKSKKTDAFGNKTHGCIWDEITNEESVTINKKPRSPAGRTTISSPQERVVFS